MKIECAYCNSQRDSKSWMTFETSFHDEIIKLNICPECNFVQGFLRKKENEEEIPYTCPNCQKTKIMIKPVSLKNYKIGILSAECECGLKITYDLNNIKDTVRINQ